MFGYIEIINKVTWCKIGTNDNKQAALVQAQTQQQNNQEKTEQPALTQQTWVCAWLRHLFCVVSLVLLFYAISLVVFDTPKNHMIQDRDQWHKPNTREDTTWTATTKEGIITTKPERTSNSSPHPVSLGTRLTLSLFFCCYLFSRVPPSTITWPHVRVLADFRFFLRFEGTLNAS